MMMAVFFNGKKLEIFETVVSLVTILVVNTFVCMNSSASSLPPYKVMFVAVASAILSAWVLIGGSDKFIVSVSHATS